jgi:hypothetical protein
MRFALTFSPFACVLFIVLALLFCRFWQSGKSAPAGSKPPQRKRARKPFIGFTRTPDCEACEQQARSQPQALVHLHPRMIVTRGRRRQVDTTGHFCWRMLSPPTDWEKSPFITRTVPVHDRSHVVPKRAIVHQ